MLMFETEVSVVRGSVLDADVEGIVNAAKTSMRGGGGLDGQVHYQAGPAMSEELAALTPLPVNVGSVVVTNGHGLKQSKILHVPAPMWQGGHQGENEDMRIAYLNIFQTAHELGLNSLAVPSIGTGIYGFPLELAVDKAFYGLAKMLVACDGVTPLKDVKFVMWGADEYSVFSNGYQRFAALWYEENVGSLGYMDAEFVLDVWLGKMDADKVYDFIER